MSSSDSTAERRTKTVPATREKWNYARWQRAVFSAIADGRITPGAGLTAWAVETYADHGTGANAFPGLERLSRDVRAGESTVRRHLRELADAGLIVKVRHGGGRNRLASVFQMTMPSWSENSAHQRAENDAESGIPGSEPVPDQYPNSAHQRAENRNSAHYSAHYSAHHSTPTTLTTLTSLGKDSGRDPQPAVGAVIEDQEQQQGGRTRALLVADAVCKMVDGNYGTVDDGVETVEIPIRFYREDDGWDDMTAAHRLLDAAVTALEATERVDDGLTYLCNAKALRMDDSAFLIKVLTALRDPYNFTKTADTA